MAPSIHDFDAATEVRRVDEARWTATLSEGWDVRGVPNGGYVLAVVANAVRRAAGLVDPLAVAAHYLAPTSPGDLDLEVHAARRGRRHATVSGLAFQDGTPVVQALATLTDLAARPTDAPHRVDTAPPAPAEPPADAPGRGFAEEGIGGRVDLRLDPRDAGFVVGEPSGEAVVRGWVRLAEDRPPDTLALLLFADAFPPAVFNAGLPVNWVPTLQLSVQVRGRPSPGWLRGVFRTRAIQGGYLEEDGELWDAEGRLVAQSRQLALAPRDG